MTKRIAAIVSILACITFGTAASVFAINQNILFTVLFGLMGLVSFGSILWFSRCPHCGQLVDLDEKV